MTPRDDLLDAEQQTTDHAAALRAEHTAAADDDDARWMAGRWVERWEMPDARDLAEMEAGR